MTEEQVKTVFEVRYKGGAYRLALRTCTDGYVSGYERAGVEGLVAGVLDRKGFFADPARTDAFMELIIDRADEGVVQQMKDGRPGEWVPRPWPHWHALDVEVIEEISRHFFHYLRRKIEPLISSSVATQNLAKLLDSIYDAKTRFFSITSEQAPASKITSGDSGTSPSSRPPGSEYSETTTRNGQNKAARNPRKKEKS